MNAVFKAMKRCNFVSYSNLYILNICNFKDTLLTRVNVIRYIHNILHYMTTVEKLTFLNICSKNLTILKNSTRDLALAI